MTLQSRHQKTSTYIGEAICGAAGFSAEASFVPQETYGPCLQTFFGFPTKQGVGG